MTLLRALIGAWRDNEASSYLVMGSVHKPDTLNVVTKRPDGTERFTPSLIKIAENGTITFGHKEKYELAVQEVANYVIDGTVNQIAWIRNGKARSTWRRQEPATVTEGDSLFARLSQPPTGVVPKMSAVVAAAPSAGPKKRPRRSSGSGGASGEQEESPVEVEDEAPTSAWSEHFSGEPWLMPFFCNSETGESTWVRPRELMDL